MNQLIKDLKLQAGINDNPDQEGLDLFAQLIIQECADLACSHNIFGRGRPWNLIIKEHFGQPIVDTDIPLYLRDVYLRDDK
jgi:hypothetical protein